MLNFKNTETAQHQQNQITQSKNGRRPKYTFSKKTYRWPTGKRKMSTSLITKEIQIKTAIEVVPRTSQNGHHQKSLPKNK